MDFDARLLDGLAVLVTIVERGNFVRAAAPLGLTTSGVSRAVTRLEERLGVRLFQRTPRGAELTDEARRLYTEVAPLLGHLADATRRAARANSAVRGRLRVSTDARLGEGIAAHLPAFLARYPELEIDLSVRTRRPALESDDFDIAVRFGPPERSSLTCRKIGETRVLTCAAPSYVARRGLPQHPRDLEQHECLNFRHPTTGKFLEWELQRGQERVAVKARGRLVVDDPITAMAACLAGQGVAQPLDVHVRDHLARGQLVQLLPDWADERWPAYAYYRGRTPSSARLRVFLDFVIELAC